jgi:hypothetical protein
MRVFLVLLALIVASPAFAFECFEHDASKESIEKHIEVASDVFLGKVVAGRLDENDPHLSLAVEVRVQHRFKGDVPDVAEVLTEAYAPFDELVLGATYIFFLYGTRELDSCGYLVPVSPTARSFDDLVDTAEHIASEVQFQADPRAYAWRLIDRVLKYFDPAP